MSSIDKKAFQSLDCSNDARKWYKNMGKRFIKNLGIKEGQKMLDFGCRVGHYTIPVAQVVSEGGIVYALDKDQDSLDTLKRNASILGLENQIRIIKTSGELIIDLPDNSIDAVLLYDVIHILIKIDKTLKPFQQLLSEINRILKPNGLLSVSIEHLREIIYSKEEIMKEIKKKISYRDSYHGKLMHWNWLKEGSVENFVLNKSS